MLTKTNHTVQERADHDCIEKIDSLLNIAMESRVADVEKSILLAQEALDFSHNTDYTKGIAESMGQLGLYNMILGNHMKGAEYAKKALKQYSALNDKVGMAEALYTLGSIDYKSAHHHLGLERLFESLKLHREVNNLKGQSRTLKAIGFIYETFKEDQKALETYIECREISRAIGDKNGESNACNPLSGLYLQRGEYDNALEAINTSIKLKRSTGDKRGLAFAYYGKGKINLYLKEYEEANDLFIRSLKRHEQVGEKLGSAMCNTKLGLLEYEKGDLPASKRYLKEAIVVGNEMNNKEILYRAYYFLYKVAVDEKRIADALEYHVLYHKNMSGLLNSDTTSRIKSLESMWRMETLEADAKAQRELNEIIQSKNNELDKFVSRVSHDLKGPISSLMGLHQIIMDEIKDEASLKYFNMYNQSLVKLNKKIVDLLDLSRVNSMDLALTKINFEDLVNECLESFKFFTNYSNIEISVDIDRSLKMTSDPRLINTILQNLLENSIKYSKNIKGKSFVRVEIKGIAEDYMCIIVEDNGIGIDEKYQSKVFDMFYRANEDVQGSGLGMYILKTAVEKLNGEVNLASELGVGTKFVALFPIIC